MTPYYEHAGIVIYHGDCRDVVLDLQHADVLLTDPPYGHGAKRWSGGTWAAAGMYDEAKQWDRAPTDDSTIAQLVSLTTVAVIWGGNYYALPPSRCWLSWIKPEGMDTLADFELAWTNLDQPSKAFRSPRNPDGKRDYPTQKPVELMQWCLGFFPAARLVLDPFMGSGTTLLAAKNLGRRAIGVDLEERYCEVAARRLSQEVLDLGAA